MDIPAKYSVLFICAANICRSPMAMGLMRLQIKNTTEEWSIHSAGIWSDNRYPAAVNTQIVLGEYGMDISTHRSTLVSRDLLNEYALVLVMEANQKEILRLSFPEFASRIFLLSEMVDENFDIVDPVGGSLNDFRYTASVIEELLVNGFERLKELAEEEPSHGIQE